MFALILDVEEIRGYDLAFRAPSRCRSRPAHRIHVQRPPNRLEQFSLRRAARPAAPELVFLGVYVFEANGLHLGCAPFLGLSYTRSEEHTSELQSPYDLV